MTDKSGSEEPFFDLREYEEDAFRSMEVQICGQTNTVQFAVSDHGGDHPTSPAVAIDWEKARGLASWILDCIPAAGSPSSWRPIHTAPKDTEILLFANGHIYAGKRRYGALGEPQQDEYGWRAYCCGRWSDPTHWMPIPQAPEAQR